MPHFKPQPIHIHRVMVGTWIHLTYSTIQSIFQFLLERVLKPITFHWMACFLSLCLSIYRQRSVYKYLVRSKCKTIIERWKKSAIFPHERKNSDWFRAQVLEVVVNSKFTHIRFNSNSLIAYLFKRHEFGRYKFWQLRQCAFFEHLTFSFPTFVNRNFEAITNKRRQLSNRLYCYFS